MIFGRLKDRIGQFLQNQSLTHVLKNSPPSYSVNEAVRFFFDAEDREIESYRQEIITNKHFFDSVKEKVIQQLPKDNSLVSLKSELVARRFGRTLRGHHNKEYVYLLVRLYKPDVVIETGTFHGMTAAVVLQAMYDNDKGTLLSIDLPAYEPIHLSTDETLPAGCRPGWLIPDGLRERHRLFFGDSKIRLPEVLREYPFLDIFIHDSLHTYQHMCFEYKLSWQHLREGGFLVSDDIFFNAAFHSFCKRINRPYVHLGTFGAVRK